MRFKRKWFMNWTNVKEHSANFAHNRLKVFDDVISVISDWCVIINYFLPLFQQYSDDRT